MYYSYDLLSLRGKGKLSKCWLAATLSEKMFKQKCKQSVIRKIDITVTCDEILSIMQTTGGVTNNRLSLYLAAQLMYGTVKLLLYKTFILEADAFSEFYLHPYRGERKDFHFNHGRINDFAEVPSLTEVLQDVEPPRDLHLIRDESYSLAVEHMMQDADFGNFGMLTSADEMEFLLPETEDLPLELENMPLREGITNPEQLVDLPTVDMEVFETELLPLSESHIKEHIVDVNREDVKASPRKRSLKPSVQTPKKRSKLILEDPAPVQEEYELTELAPALIERTKQSRTTRLIVDAHTRIDGNKIRNWISNIQVHTDTKLLEAVKLKQEGLFDYPTTSKNGSCWGRTLLETYKKHLIGPFTASNDFSFAPAEAELFTSIEAVREETLVDKSKIAELSSKITFLEVNDTSAHPNVVEHTEPVENVLVAKEQTEGFIHDQTEEYMDTSLVQMPNISELYQPTSPLSSVSRTYLSKKELKALLEVHWRDQESVKFADVISPDTYDRIDAAYAFSYILELHMESFLVLHQADPFEPIWIEKYDSYM